MSQLVKKIRTESGDLQIDYNALANLPELNTMFSNPNLLINSDFRKPVNQRGQTSYAIPANTYTIDRWKVLSDSATLSVSDGYIALTGNNSTSSYFIQKIENVPMDDYITVSINVKSLTGTLNVYIASSSQEECFSIYSAGITTYTTSVKFTNFMQLNIEAIKGTNVELYWAKVEQGTVATPFVPRLYVEELALCQRYYEKRIIMFTPLGGATPATYYIAVNGGQHFAKKRAMPTVSAGTIYNQSGADSGAAIKTFTQTVDGLRMIQLEESCSSYALRSTVEFDAEFY